MNNVCIKAQLFHIVATRILPNLQQINKTYDKEIKDKEEKREEEWEEKRKREEDKEKKIHTSCCFLIVSS